jgi:hypothetical protein
VEHVEALSLPPRRLDTGLVTLRRELYSNWQSLPFTLGGGQYGSVGLLMPGALYATLPPSPSSTSIQRCHGGSPSGKDACEQEMYTYVELHAFINHLKALIIKALPHRYISEFSDDVMGYATATPARGRRVR